MKVAGQLVDFVQEEDRVHGAALPHALKHSSGQRSHVGPSMAADLGLVSNPAQTDPDELPPERIGQAPPQRSLTDSGRADQAKDRSL